MTTRKNSRAARARAARPATAVLAGETRDALVGRLRRMADEVELLQSEIAAVEAFVTEPDATSSTAQVSASTGITEMPVMTAAATRPGAGWTPSPTPQPWLVARSA